MASHDIIVMGASAGGVEAVRTIVSGLPSRLQAAVFVVLHTAPEAPGMLADLLQRRSRLPVRIPNQGDPITPGTVCVAPPDHHLELTRNAVRLSRGPRENRQRPAVDVLFRSAARVFGPRVIGVILSGYLDDGSAGLLAVKRHGGIAIVQDPATAEIPYMPRNAGRNVPPDYSLPLDDIAPVLANLAGSEAPVASPAKPESKPEGPPTGLTCPECGGALWETGEDDMLEFRCRVGHRYLAESMLVDQDAAVERALWAAMRILEERTQVSERLARKAAGRNSARSEAQFRELARESRANAGVIRAMLLDRPGQEELLEAEERLEVRPQTDVA